jgi:glycosyltransferase involved in cell wall biosynthesis
MENVVLLVGRLIFSRSMDGRTRYYIQLIKELNTIEVEKPYKIQTPPVYILKAAPTIVFLLEQVIMILYSIKINLANNLKKKKIIVHVTYPELIWFTLLLNGVKIVTFHDLYAYKNFKEKSVKKLLWNIYATLCYKIARYSAHYFIAVSDETKKEIVEKIGIKKQKIIVIPPGIDHIISIDKIYGKEKSVAFIGRCESKKDPIFFVKTIKELLMLDNTWKVYLIGRDCERIYRYLVNTCNLEIYYKIYVSDSELASIYRSLFCLLHPAQSEGFGLTIVEALSNGVHVIVKENSLIPAFIKRACIRVSSPREAARIIIDSWKNYVDGHTTIEKTTPPNISWKTMARRLSKLYTYIISH